MARARQRTWPMTVYRYAVKPLWGTRLPDPVWAMVQAQQALWNRLVAIREDSSAAYDVLMAQCAPVQEAQAARDEAQAAYETSRASVNAERARQRRATSETLTALQAEQRRASAILKQARATLAAAKRQAKTGVAPELKALNERLQAALYDACKASALPWTLWLPIHERFLAGLQAWWRQQRQPPRRHTGPIRDIHLTWQHTGGGLPMSRVAGDRHSFTLTWTPGESWGQAQLGVGPHQLPLQVRVHQAWPEGAYLKRVSLVGRQRTRPLYYRDHRVDAVYDWWLHLVLEVPPGETVVQPTDAPIAAIDLNWRLVDDRLRIGALVDTDGHAEALWQHPAHLPPRQHLLARWRYTQALQSASDAALEATKAALGQLTWPEDLPQEIQALRHGWAQVRHGGLRRLLAWAEGAGAWVEGRDVLRAWATAYARQYREWRGVETRLLRMRRWHYEQQARALCQRYRVIVLEALDLAQMTRRSEDKDPGIQASDQYRRLASLSEWVGILTRMAPTFGTEIRRVNPAYSTVTCGQCGAIAENTGAITLTCPNGHTWDVDDNAARNLLYWSLASGSERREQPDARAPDAGQS